MRREKPDSLKKIEKMLRSYHRVKKEIALDEAYLEEEPLTGISYDGISTSNTYKVTSATETEVLRRMKKQERLRNNKARIREIDGALTLLDDDQRTIIEQYYIEDMSWFIVTDIVKISETHSRRKRNKALTIIQEYIFNEKYDYVTGHSQQALSV